MTDYKTIAESNNFIVLINIPSNGWLPKMTRARADSYTQIPCVVPQRRTGAKTSFPKFKGMAVTKL